MSIILKDIAYSEWIMNIYGSMPLTFLIHYYHTQNYISLIYVEKEISNCRRNKTRYYTSYFNLCICFYAVLPLYKLKIVHNSAQINWLQALVWFNCTFSTQLYTVIIGWWWACLGTIWYNCVYMCSRGYLVISLLWLVAYTLEVIPSPHPHPLITPPLPLL